MTGPTAANVGTGSASTGGVVPPLSWRWVAAFAVLVLVLHELHEIAHTWTGRLVCEAWGSRDFNTWSLAEGCEAWLPTAAGPLFTYLVMWVGVLLLDAGRRPAKHVGLALLFGADPAARIVTVALGGGDELVVASSLVGGGGAGLGLWLSTLGVVLLICVPALWSGWRALRPARRRGLWFAGLFFGPFGLVIAVILVGLNGVLAAGVLAGPPVLGEPPLVLVSTILFAGSLALTARWLAPSRANSAA